MSGVALIDHSHVRSSMEEYDDLPIVYSCSGCSSAAQMANDLAVTLDREQIAEMSCIAGVGGGVAPLVETATSGRPIVAIDGCPLKCTKASLANHDVEPDLHYMLAAEGVPKEYHVDYDDEQADELFDEVAEAVERLAAET